MNDLKIILMRDGSLCDLESLGESVAELLPTVYKIDVGNTSYTLGEDSNDFFNRYNNATEVTIHLLAYKNEIEIEKVDW